MIPWVNCSDLMFILRHGGWRHSEISRERELPPPSTQTHQEMDHRIVGPTGLEPEPYTGTLETDMISMQVSQGRRSSKNPWGLLLYSVHQAKVTPTLGAPLLHFKPTDYGSKCFL